MKVLTSILKVLPLLILLSTGYCYGDENKNDMNYDVKQHEIESKAITAIKNNAVANHQYSTQISKFNTIPLSGTKVQDESEPENTATVQEKVKIFQKIINSNSVYIAPDNFIQNPYTGLPSGGGTHLDKSESINTMAKEIFENGTWNAMGALVFDYANHKSGQVGFPVFAYGANAFAQTGHVEGFSVGGLVTVNNPFFANQINPSEEARKINFIPSYSEVNFAQAFAEYQFDNIVQIDAGLIAINNSPWLSNNYYKDDIAPGANYQGVLASVYPGDGWLITAAAFNASQLIGNNGFTPYTYYNTSVDVSSGLFNTNDGTASNGTLAIGSNYTTMENRYNLRMWAYQFQNYGNLLYADTNIRFEPVGKLSFNLSAQGGIDRQNGSTSAFTNTGYGSISSNFVGLQGAFNYDWFGLNIGYNNIWGPNNAYGNGAISTPYTYGFATDPLYSTPYISGLNEFSTSGQAFKITPTMSFLNNNLNLSTAWTHFNTTDPYWNGTDEYDFISSYSLPEVRGLSLFAVYANQRTPTLGNNAAITRVFFSYIY